MADWIASAFEETFNLPFRQFYKPNVPYPGFLPWDKLAHHDLRLYAQTAVLPKMVLSTSLTSVPEQTSRSHRNRLCIEHEPYRTLEIMYNIGAFAETAQEFCLSNLPMTRTGDADFDDENGGGITVVAPGFQLRSAAPIGKPSDVDRVLKWVVEYPLATVNHMMHLVYPATADYTLREGTDPDLDKHLFRWAVWGRDENTITEVQDTWSESVMVFVQPPWIVTEADLEAFVDCPTFPPPTARTKLNSQERLWGKILDLCTQKRSHWFVLTTYWGWVFGAFSAGRTRAFTSDIIPFDSKEPTVLQCLFFWFTSAVDSQLRTQGVWTIPEVPEPVGDSAVLSNADSMNIEPSESSWSAYSDARSHTPSAVDSDDDPDLRSAYQRQRIGLVTLAWGERNRRALAHAGRGPPSEAPSGTSITTTSSLSTVVDLAADERGHGRRLSRIREEERHDYRYVGQSQPW